MSAVERTEFHRWRLASLCTPGIIGLSSALVCMAAGLVLCVPVNHDEGWILLAGRSWTDGLRPHVDYAFPQGPGLAAVYGWGQEVFGTGLWGGRTTSFFLAMATAGLTAAVARRSSGAGAGTLATGLLVLNPLVLGHLVLVKGYALGAFMLALALRFLCMPGPRGAALGSGVLAFATLWVRLSLAGPLLALLLGSRVHRGHLWVGAVVGALLGGLAQGSGGTEAVAAVLDVHLGPYGAAPLHEMVGAKLWLLVAMASLVAPALALVSWTRPGRGTLPLGWMVVLGFAAHLVPGTHHGHYVVLLWPLLAVWCCRGGVQPGLPRRLLLVGACLHGIWGLWNLEFREAGQRPGEHHRRIAAVVEANTEPGEVLLGFHPLVAVEAGRRVPSGLELGYFSLAREQSKQRLVPREVVDMVREPNVGAVLLGSRVFLHDGWNRGFSPEVSRSYRDELSEAAAARFCQQIQWHSAGQFQETMTLYLEGECP